MKNEQNQRTLLENESGNCGSDEVIAEPNLRRVPFETGWLIEMKPAHGQMPTWWGRVDDGERILGWTTDPNKAIRFARAQDAQAIIDDWTEAAPDDRAAPWRASPPASDAPCAQRRRTVGEAKRRRAAADEVLPNGIRLVRSQPTPEARQIGETLAEMADEGEPLVRQQYPAHEPRCKSCAFTRGTLPNGCPETVVDAMGALIEGDVVFMCHQRFDDDGRPKDICAGAQFAAASRRAKTMAQLFGGKLLFDTPGRSPEVQSYIDEERRKIRENRRR